MLSEAMVFRYFVRRWVQIEWCNKNIANAECWTIVRLIQFAHYYFRPTNAYFEFSGCGYARVLPKLFNIIMIVTVREIFTFFTCHQQIHPKNLFKHSLITKGNQIQMVSVYASWLMIPIFRTLFAVTAFRFNFGHNEFIR